MGAAWWAIIVAGVLTVGFFIFDLTRKNYRRALLELVAVVGAACFLLLSVPISNPLPPDIPPPPDGGATTGCPSGQVKCDGACVDPESPSCLQVCPAGRCRLAHATPPDNQGSFGFLLGGALVASLFGMGARYIFYLRGAFSWRAFARPLVVSPLVIAPLAMALVDVDAKVTIKTFISTGLLAFQNGFFWQVVLEARKRELSGKQAKTESE